MIRETKETLIELFDTVLKKNGLTGALFALLLVSVIYDNYRTAEAQLELNSSIESHLHQQADREERRLELIEDLSEAIKTLANSKG